MTGKAFLRCKGDRGRLWIDLPGSFSRHYLRRDRSLGIPRFGTIHKAQCRIINRGAPSS